MDQQGTLFYEINSIANLRFSQSFLFVCNIYYKSALEQNPFKDCILELSKVSV